MLKVSLTQSECWLGRAGAPCQRVQTQRSGGSPVRRRGALLVSVRFLSQSTTRTDRQTSTQTHTHTVFRCVRRVSGSSADLSVSHVSHPLFRENTVGAASPTLCCHTPNTHPAAGRVHAAPQLQLAVARPLQLAHRGGSRTL